MLLFTFIKPSSVDLDALHGYTIQHVLSVGHILCRNCLLRQGNEGKIIGVIEVTED
jgi:hypothetical protein